LSSSGPFFDLAPRLYEKLGADAKLLGHGDQVRLMRFEKADQRGKKRRLARPKPKLVRPDSGQVEEALRPALVAER
jgi:hypothetical protein